MKNVFKQTPITIITITLVLILYLLGVILLELRSINDIYQFSYINKLTVFTKGQLWRIITCNFVHLNFNHIFANVIAFVFFSYWLETLISRRNYLVIYSIVGILSAFVTTIFQNEFVIIDGVEVINKTVGLSSIIFGLLGSFIAISLLQHNLSNKRYLVMIYIVTIVSLISTFAIDGVSIVGHISGLLLGFIACVVLYYQKRNLTL